MTSSSDSSSDSEAEIGLQVLATVRSDLRTLRKVEYGRSYKRRESTTSPYTLLYQLESQLTSHSVDLFHKKFYESRAFSSPKNRQEFVLKESLGVGETLSLLKFELDLLTSTIKPNYLKNEWLDGLDEYFKGLEQSHYIRT